MYKRQVSDAAVGTGPTLAGATDVARMPDGSAVLVLGGDELTSVDLTTGNRVTVTSAAVGAGPLFGWGSIDVVVDPSGDVAYVLGHECEAIFAVRLLTGERVIVSK